MNSPRFFVIKKEGAVQCDLCPRNCLLASGEEGRCKVRFNREGKPELPFYGFVTSLAVDPIEKKPLYHFLPGTEILSAGFAGCNLHCPFCQNWRISQSTSVPGRFFSPAELVAEAGRLSRNAGQAAGQSLAYTYSEPLVHIEFLLDCMNEGRKTKTANVLVTNGCVNKDAAEEILSLTDAANIDLKCFSDETYRTVLGGDLGTVKNFITMALEKGVHIELTTLLVPGLNDGKEELDRCRDFISELESGGNTVPWHLSAYHPDYKWSSYSKHSSYALNSPPATSAHSLIAAVKRAREKVKFAYAGNIPGDNDTLCPGCGKILIGRRGYMIDVSGLQKENGRFICASCGKKAPIR